MTCHQCQVSGLSGLELQAVDSFGLPKLTWLTSSGKGNVNCFKEFYIESGLEKLAPKLTQHHMSPQFQFLYAAVKIAAGKNFSCVGCGQS